MNGYLFDLLHSVGWGSLSAERRIEICAILINADRLPCPIGSTGLGQRTHRAIPRAITDHQ